VDGSAATVSSDSAFVENGVTIATGSNTCRAVFSLGRRGQLSMSIARK
jgi:hypothetical protein